MGTDPLSFVAVRQVIMHGVITVECAVPEHPVTEHGATKATHSLHFFCNQALTLRNVLALPHYLMVATSASFRHLLQFLNHPVYREVGAVQPLRIEVRVQLGV